MWVWHAERIASNLSILFCSKYQFSLLIAIHLFLMLVLGIWWYIETINISLRADDNFLYTHPICMAMCRITCKCW